MKGKNRRIPLNCIDKAMFALHTRNEPMTLHCVLTAKGSVEPARLRYALMSAAERCPCLRGTIRNGLLWHVRQMQDVSVYDPLTVSDLTARLQGAARDFDDMGTLRDSRLAQWIRGPFDPTRDLPWRVLLLRSSDTESTLVFTFHHSATDGLGALRFVTMVMDRYNGVVEEPPPIHQRSSALGDELVALGRADRAGISHFYLKIMASLFHRFAIAPWSPNSRISRAAANPSPGVYFCQAQLDPYELERIRARLRAANSTVNDVLLAAGFKTIDQWNAIQGKPSRKIAIMVPVDVGRGNPSPTNGNRVSFMSVSTSRSERANLEDLLRLVHQRTSKMLRNGTAFSIVYAVDFCCRFPPQVPKAVALFLLATRVYLDSMLVTNLREIRLGTSSSSGGGRMGNTPISRVIVLPPVVSPMGASLSACTYNDYLNVALTYKTSHFPHAEARLFLNLFMHQLRSYQRTAGGALAARATVRAARETASATRP